MTRFSRARETRFFVPGPPVSFRSPNSLAYKKQIQRIASSLFATPLRKPFHVYVDIFHRQPRRVDVDNVAKCVMDALSGLAYVDDKHVELAAARSFSLLDWISLPDGPIDLVKPLKTTDEYVFVRVRESG